MPYDLVETAKLIILLSLRMLNHENTVAFFNTIPCRFAPYAIALFKFKIMSICRAVISVKIIHTQILIIYNKDIIGTIIYIFRFRV
ncbi:hypothetical protein D3C72_1727820 [compost metagenome]